VRKPIIQSKYVRATVAAMAAGAVTFVIAGPAAATPSSFTAGDLVVSAVTESSGSPSSTAGTVSLIDYSTAGTASGYSVTMPTSDSSGSHALVDSGSATNNGLLTLSADGQYLYSTGYDAAPGTTKITSSTANRVVAITPMSGSPDTSTAYTDSATDTASVNFRSATGPTGGSSDFYNGGDAGLGYTADAATTNTLIDSTDSGVIHEVQLSYGNLYASAKGNILQYGTPPTSGPVTGTALLASPPSKFSPDGFAFVSLSGGSSPDTLYAADPGNNALDKFSLVGGVWTARGSVTIQDVTGLAVSVSGSTATLYVTNGVGSNTYATQISTLTDGSGAGGTLSSGTTVTPLVTAATSTSFHGLVLLPSSLPGSMVPEAPWTWLLPVTAAAIAGAVVLVTRRRRGAGLTA